MMAEKHVHKLKTKKKSSKEKRKTLQELPRDPMEVVFDTQVFK